MLSELNGFKIDKFNQYNLPLNVKTHTCPICSADRKKSTQKCMKVFWDTGMAHCSHCGETIQLHSYKKKEHVKEYKRPEWKNNTTLSSNLVKWFESRKISQFTLRRLKISEGKEWMPQTGKDENCIQFNYFRDDELINIKYRDGRKNFKLVKDGEKIPYNLDNIRTTDEAIIVEGEIDALSCVECGRWDVVSSPNGSTTGNVNLEWLDNSYEYFENKTKIILALDDDEPGQNVQKELIRRLGAERCFLVDLSPCKDLNEVLTTEGVESVTRRINEAKQCPLENVVTFKDVEADLYDFYANGSKKGYQIGLKGFDEIFSTYTKQFIVVTGIPTHGKSDFVDQMCVGYNRNYNFKIAYCSVENEPRYLHVDKICRKYLGYKPTLNDTSTVKWNKVKKRIENDFNFIEYSNGYELNTILLKAAELVMRKGIKVLVLDPFNKIHLKGSNRSEINQYTNDYLNAIDIFCKKYDVLVILVAHPVKMQKINGVTPEPDFYSIKGGGEFYDMSYHGLLVHRDFDRKTVKIKVLKVKFSNLGENQAECNYMWDWESGRYNFADVSPDNVSCNFDKSFWLEDKTEQKKIELTQEELNDPFGGQRECEF